MTTTATHNEHDTTTVLGHFWRWSEETYCMQLMHAIFESMENLGMMPRRASPRPPWRVAPAWRGSSEFERCVHDADRSPEVCR